MTDPAGATVLAGTVERITFYNAETGFSVVKLRVRGAREPVAVVGTLPAVQPGEMLVLRGSWRTDPRHGAQFSPQHAEVSLPSDEEGIVRYLGSGLIRQIGPVLAERIVSTFGPATLEILDAAPDRVREVAGIGRQRAQAIVDAWIEHRALREIIAFLSEHGLDTRFAPRLLRAFGSDAPRILGANPYRLVAEVQGLGFAAADRVGRDLGVRPASAARLQAAVHAVLLRAAEAGHTRMAREDLAAAAAASAGVEEALAASAVIQQLARGVITAGSADLAQLAIPVAGPDMRGRSARATVDGRDARAVAEARQPYGAIPGERPAGSGLPLFTVPSGDPAVPAGDLKAPDDADPPVSPSLPRRVRVYEPTVASAPDAADGPGLGLAALVSAEEDLAGRLRALAGHQGLPEDDITHWLAGNEAARALSAEQRRAVATAAGSGCFVLTGGPGVGKTTTTRTLVRLLIDHDRSVALAAPTGKAAKRLGEVVGLEASTLHRLLGAGPSGFRHGPREPLPYDVVIVDECSMLDTQLARSVLAAIGLRTQLVLVGDADQLPSVGAGQVLRDLLASGTLPSAALTTVFRQAAKSQIVTNAHRIRQGLLPIFAGAEALAGGKSDCIFVPASPGRVAEVAACWAAERLPGALGVPAPEVQALAPLRSVCQALNSTLQERLNPARGQDERPHGALPLRVGDRVIQTRNNYDLGVFNGDTGVIAAVEPDRLAVRMGDDRDVEYAAADLLDLDHAYCLTVHRSQGSEWPGVVLLASPEYGRMLTRNLLYTALTRARRAVVVVGDHEAIARAVAETRDAERRTGLRWLLAGGEGRDGDR